MEIAFKRILQLTGILLILWGTAFPLLAETGKMVASPAKDYIFLRWERAKEQTDSVDIYRKMAGNEKWIKINDKPVRKVQNRAAFLKSLGEDYFKDTAPEQLETKKNDLYDQFLNESTAIRFASFYYYPLAEALGIVYKDKHIKPKTEYHYEVRSTDGKIIASTSVFSSDIPQISPPAELKAESAKEMIVLKFPVTKQQGILGYNVYRNEKEQGEYKKINPLIIAYAESEEISDSSDSDTSKKKKKKQDNPGRGIVTYQDQVQEGQEFWYTVTSVHFSGLESEFSKKAKGIAISKDRPTPLFMIAAEQSNEGGVLIRWKPSEGGNVAYYDVYKAGLNEKTFIKINNTPIPKNADRFVDINISENDIGKSFWYKTKIMTKTGVESDYSIAMSVAIKPLNKPPAVTGVTAKLEEEFVKIIWQSPIHERIDRYEVFRSLTQNEGYVSIGHIEPNQNSFIDKDVKPGTTYHYRVHYRDDYGNLSKPSEVAAITTEDYRPPVAPVMVKATAQQNKVLVSWKPVVTSELASFNVYRKTNLQPKFEKVNAQPVAASNPIFSEVLDTDAEEVEYYVVAVSKKGKVSGPSLSSKTSIFPPPLPVVKNLQAYPSSVDLNITITWTNPKQNTIAGYKVFRRDIETGKTEVLNTEPVEADVFSFSDNTITAGKKYLYTVRTISRSGKLGNPSAEVQAYVSNQPQSE